MKRIWKPVAYLALLTTISCESPDDSVAAPAVDPYNMALAPQTNISPVPDQPQPPTNKKKIKVALLLDTSGSMSGLIEQAKIQLWKIVNQLAKAKDADGEDPEIEIALYQYGNDGLNAYNGYVEKISGFTSELDDISQQLFALYTNGGEEYCGEVIHASLDELNWGQDSGDLRMIFIAGNEPFNQGTFDYNKACGEAAFQDVIVNTIFCGHANEGIQSFWKDGATIGHGKYMTINHESQIVHVNTPYDKQIVTLNTKLNQTYVHYGYKGVEKKINQTSQDQNAMTYGVANAAKRSLSKSSKAYKNYSWDLVDKSEEASFNIESIAEDQLPEEMRGMDTSEKEAYILENKKKRDSIKEQMNELNKLREAYVVKVKMDSSTGDSQLEDAMINAIIEQAKSKNYSFTDAIN